MREHDVIFDAMGSHVRLLIGEPGPGMAPGAGWPPSRRGDSSSSSTQALSRFKPDSELCALNADPRERVPASELLRTAVKAGLTAAERSGGLVDPTLVGEIESAGYVASRAGMPGAPLGAALAEAPPRRPASPQPGRQLAPHSRSTTRPATITRPPGVRFDTGGTGKGLAADLVAQRLRGYSRFIVDCGGDIRIGGADALVSALRGLRRAPADRRARLRAQARLRRRRHLGPQRADLARRATAATPTTCSIPATGEPAWTGLIGATALGDTALEAETLRQGGAALRPRGRARRPRRARRPARPRRRPDRAGRAARRPSAHSHPRPARRRHERRRRRTPCRPTAGGLPAALPACSPWSW